jgi:HEAT repeat protein
MDHPDKKTEDTSEALLQALGDDDWRVRREAADGLIRHGSPEAVATLLKSLIEEHRDFSALSSAIEVLSLSEIDVLVPLVRLLEEPDEGLRIQVAQILGERGDAGAVPGLMEALNDPDANVRYHVIEALGKLRAEDAVDALVAVVESRDFSLAFPALDALARIGDASVAPRLVPLLKDDLLRTPTAELLGRLGDDAIIVPLVDLLNEPGIPVAAVAQALASLYDRYETLYGEGGYVRDLVRTGIRAPGVQNLIDALSSTRGEEIRPLADVLGWMEGQAMERALSRLLGHPEARKEVVEAFIRHGRRVTNLLMEQLAAEDLEIRLAAVMALGRIGDPAAVPALTEVLQNEPELAILTAGALAKIGDLRPFEPLITMLAHPEAAVRQAVISALNSMGHPDMPGRILILLEDPDPKIRESAVKIAGYFSYPQCVERFLDRTRDPEENIRRAAVESLPYLEDDRAFSHLVHALLNDSPKVRAAAAKALSHTEGREALPHLLKALEDEAPWVRFYAARSMGRHRSTAAAEALTERITRDPAQHVRIEAIKALAEIDGKGTLSLLTPLVKDPDPDIARAAIRGLGIIGHPGALAPLFEALGSTDPELRIAVLHALGERRDPEVPEKLQWVATTDRDEKVVAMAMQILSKL